MNFKKICLTFLSVMISVTPCCSNAMEEEEKKDNENLPICVICLNPMKEGEQIESSGCSSTVPHEFHTSCLNAWRTQTMSDQRTFKCPFCKGEVKVNPHCTICGELIQDEGGIAIYSCGHSAHWSCLCELQDALKKYDMPLYVDFCAGCEDFSKCKSGVLSSEKTNRLSPDQLETLVELYYKINFPTHAEEKGQGKRNCTMCGELIKITDSVAIYGCGHLTHWSCISDLKDALKKHRIESYVDFCAGCLTFMKAKQIYVLGGNKNRRCLLSSDQLETLVELYKEGYTRGVI